MSDITRILENIHEGDGQSAGELLPLVYDELRRLAALKLANEAAGHTLQPTALVHEAWLRLGGDDAPRFKNSAHFFAAAAEAMRRILIDRARRRSRVKHGHGLERIDWEAVPITAPEREETLLRMDEALVQLEAEQPDTARIVKLKFFVGLTTCQIADTLGVAERSVERTWTYAKAWLVRAMRTQS